VDVRPHWAARALKGALGRQEALLAELRSDHARARAMDLLVMADPVANDEHSYRLRELAIRYLEVAQQLEAEEDGQGNRSDEPSELISAALDAVARDYFSHMSHQMALGPEDFSPEDLSPEGSDQANKWDGG
jgi:hypothetical protein